MSHAFSTQPGHVWRFRFGEPLTFGSRPVECVKERQPKLKKTFSQGTNTKPSQAERLQQALVQDRDSLQFSDFSIFVDEKEFKCHRIVLATMSAYFRSMFSSGMKEATEGHVHLQDVSCQVFADVLQWMYEGECTLTNDNMLHVLSAADLLDAEGLMSDCKIFISQNICLDNCIAVYHASQLYDQNKIFSQRAKGFLLRNFDKVSVSEDFYKLGVKDIKSLITAPGLITRSEDLVIESILRWVHFQLTPISEEWQANEAAEDHGSYPVRNERYKDAADTQASKKVTEKVHCTSSNGDDNHSNEKEQHRQQILGSLADLFESTRYHLVSGNCLWQTIARDPLIQADRRCRAIQEEIIRYKTQVERHQDGCLPAACHRSLDGRGDFVLTCSGHKIAVLPSHSSWSYLKIGCPTESAKSLVYYDRRERTFVHSHTDWNEMGISFS